MAMAVTLIQAAGLTLPQMRIKQLGTTLVADVETFITTSLALFPDAVPNNRPVANWLVPLSSIQEQMVTLAQDPSRAYQGMNLAADVVSKMCWAGSKMQDAGLITAGQETALLAAWNTAFGT